jgi:hypothetical protein
LDDVSASPELGAELLTVPPETDMMTASARCFSMKLELWRPDGTIIPIEYIFVRDLVYTLSLPDSPIDEARFSQETLAGIDAAVPSAGAPGQRCGRAIAGIVPVVPSAFSPSRGRLCVRDV